MTTWSGAGTTAPPHTHNRTPSPTPAVFHAAPGFMLPRRRHAALRRGKLRPDVRMAVEFRDRAWFRGEAEQSSLTPPHAKHRWAGALFQRTAAAPEQHTRLVLDVCTGPGPWGHRCWRSRCALQRSSPAADQSRAGGWATRRAHAPHSSREDRSQAFGALHAHAMSARMRVCVCVRRRGGAGGLGGVVPAAPALPHCRRRAQARDLPGAAPVCFPFLPEKPFLPDKPWRRFARAPTVWPPSTGAACSAIAAVLEDGHTHLYRSSACLPPRTCRCMSHQQPARATPSCAWRARTQRAHRCCRRAEGPRADGPAARAGQADPAHVPRRHATRHAGHPPPPPARHHRPPAAAARARGAALEEHACPLAAAMWRTPRPAERHLFIGGQERESRMRKAWRVDASAAAWWRAPWRVFLGTHMQLLSLAWSAIRCACVRRMAPQAWARRLDDIAPQVQGPIYFLW